MSPVERQLLPDAIEASHGSRTRRNILSVKVLGRLGTVLVRETRRTLAGDKEVDPAEKRYHDLIDRARSFGDAGREDDAAVSELRALAGAEGTELLDRAAQWFSVEGGSLMKEFDNWDRSYRLLRAAGADGIVEPVSVTRAEFFKQVSSLEGAPSDLGWARLVGVQPALAELDAEIRALNSIQEDLNDRLRSLVGPSASNVPDSILATRTAQAVAENHLGVVFRNSRSNGPS